jgi:glycine/D-amino acid oxidase-like deaminating enzyme
MKLSRRAFLAGTAALLTGCGERTRTYPGAILGAGSALGHRVRDGGFPAPTSTEDTSVVIVGGGIAGLAAARRLHCSGARDFVLLELESAAGGNAASGRNTVSAYPWGAHYLPLPNEESVEVRELVEDLGLVTGHAADGMPIYREEALCADPMERLFDYGRWHEGLIPQLGLTSEDREQYTRFAAQMETWRQTRGTDGRPAFAIPLDRSSRDFFDLDQIPMSAWLAREGYTSAPLLWHVDYSCRDDYGAGSAQVSAWAGLHYFASRRGRAANATHDAVLTWPEGNGWLVTRLTEPVRERIRTGCAAFAIDPEAGTVDCFVPAENRSRRLRAKAILCCAPRFIAQRLVRGLPPANGLEYSPWMVANVTLDALPSGHGAPLAWDNVFRDSRSLGYVVATHQNLHPVPRETVLTHYWPLDSLSPAEERRRALARSHPEWCAEIVADLRRAHPEIDPHIRNIDVWLWGHGMIRPVPGFISGQVRAAMQLPVGRVHFAHSDQSGISIFEEAYTRGVQAADAIRATLVS